MVHSIHDDNDSDHDKHNKHNLHEKGSNENREHEKVYNQDKEHYEDRKHTNEQNETKLHHKDHNAEHEEQNSHKEKQERLEQIPHPEHSEHQEQFEMDENDIVEQHQKMNNDIMETPKKSHYSLHKESSISYCNRSGASGEGSNVIMEQYASSTRVLEHLETPIEHSIGNSSFTIDPLSIDPLKIDTSNDHVSESDLHSGDTTSIRADTGIRRDKENPDPVPAIVSILHSTKEYCISLLKQFNTFKEIPLHKDARKLSIYIKSYIGIMIEFFKILKGSWLTFFKSFIESMKILWSMYEKYGKKYQRTILLGVFLSILIYKHWKNIISPDFVNTMKEVHRFGLEEMNKNNATNIKASQFNSSMGITLSDRFEKRRGLFLHGRGSSNRVNTRPYQNSLDWFSEAMISSRLDVNGSIYHRSRVKIGSSAFLRKYPNRWLNMLAKIYILFKYRWIEWVRRIEWWFVGGWGLISSIGVLNSLRNGTETSNEGVGGERSDRTPSRYLHSGTSTNTEDVNSVATLHRVINKENTAAEDKVLATLDAHFQEKMRSTPWIQKMDSYLHGDPNENVISGSNIPAEYPVGSQAMGNFHNLNFAHLSNFQMHRMR